MRRDENEKFDKMFDMLFVKNFLNEFAKNFDDLISKNFFIQNDANDVAKNVKIVENFDDVNMMFRTCETTTKNFFIRDDENDITKNVMIFDFLT